jgi:hypothetical protein
LEVIVDDAEAWGKPTAIVRRTPVAPAT